MTSHLTETYVYKGWNIKYTFLKSETTSTNNGAVKTVVFVHGTPWASDVFLPIAKALSTTGKYKILLYDLLGYGASQTRQSSGTGTIDDTSTRTQGEVLSSLLENLGIDGKNGNQKSIVVAHDIAGVISLRAHLLLGCQYASLCLLDTNVVLPWGDKFYNLVRDHPEIFNEFPHGIFENVVRGVIQSASVNDPMPRHWEETLLRHWVPRLDASTEEQRKNSQRCFVKQISDSKDADSAELLDKNLYPKVACDVKILWGEKDSWIPKHKMEKLASMLGDRCKAFVTIPDASHLIMVDQPERVTFEIATWIESFR